MSKKIQNLKGIKAPPDAPVMEWKDIVEAVIFSGKVPAYDQSRIHLKELIRKKGLKFADVARTLGTNTKNFYHTLNGKSRRIENMPLWKCHKIALVLQISLDELLSVSLENRSEFLAREYKVDEVLE